MFSRIHRSSRRLLHTACLTAMSAVLLQACPTSPEDEEPTQTSRTQAEVVSDLNTTYRQLYAKSVMECPQAHDVVTLKLWSQQGAMSNLNPRFQEATARQSFDVARGEQCLTQLESMLATEDGCTIFPIVTSQHLFRDACADLITGLGQLDDTCTFYSECADGLICESQSSSEVCGEGLCKPDPNACAQACAAGEYCDNVDTTQTPECKALQAMGDACVLDSECVAGLYCHGADRTCQPLSALVPSSQAVLAQGDTCNPNTPRPAPWCDTGLFCVGVDPTSGDGTCGAPRTSGESCFVDTECEGALACLGRDPVTMQSGTCGDRKALGESCTVNDGCMNGYCAAGVCTAKKKPGQACVPGDGSCETQCSSSGVCEEPGGGPLSRCY